MKDDVEFRKFFGQAIRERRVALDMTIDQLCEATGLSRGFMSQIENGHRGGSVRRILMISRALDCTIDWLARGWQE